eukprot:4105271-Amphidinium_carterae.1
MIRVLPGLQDSASIVREWNSTCPEKQKLVGAKATALRSLLSWPEGALAALDEHVSLLTWESCAFTETALSNSKLTPGYIFKKARDPHWNGLCTVTDTSIVLMVKHLVSLSTVSSVSKQNRTGARKLDKQAVEAACEQSAFVENMGAEAVRVHHLSEADVRASLLSDWEAAEPQLVVAVQSVLHDKGKVEARDLPSLRQLLDKRLPCAGDDQGASAVGGELVAQARLIEESTFQLLKEQLNYDFNAAAVFLKAVAHYNSACDLKRRQYTHERYEHNMLAAKAWMDNHAYLIEEQAGDMAFRALETKVASQQARTKQ